MRRDLKESFYVNFTTLHPEVTGSCHDLIINYPDGFKERILVDFGLFQEPKYEHLNSEIPFDPKNIDHVIVTHGHIDHIGRLPLLVRKGYKGNIYATNDTRCIIPYALYDTAGIFKRNSKYAHTKPLFEETDVASTVRLVRGYNYEETFNLSENIRCTFLKNAHLVGASMVLLQISYYGCDDINYLFTGDYNVGNIFFDVSESLPEWVLDLNINVVCESTYGNTNSQEIKFTFKDEIMRFLAKQRKNRSPATIIIPTPSLERAQHILAVLKNMQDNDELSTNVPIYLDGKLTQKYTQLFLSGGLETVEDTDFIPKKFKYVDDKHGRNKLYNGKKKSKIIISSSGMGTHGPSKTYIQQYLDNPNTLIFFTCYLAEETLGRQIMNVKRFQNTEIGGMKIKKACYVLQTNEFSGHAKSDDLLDLLKRFKNLNTVFIGHGPLDAKSDFADMVVDQILNCKHVCILSRVYLYRLKSNGRVETVATHFRNVCK